MPQELKYLGILPNLQCEEPTFLELEHRVNRRFLLLHINQVSLLFKALNKQLLEKSWAKKIAPCHAQIRRQSGMASSRP
jgi:hypothetical protein